MQFNYDHRYGKPNQTKLWQAKPDKIGKQKTNGKNQWQNLKTNGKIKKTNGKIKKNQWQN